MNTMAYFSAPKTLRRVHQGPLGPYVDEFARWLPGTTLFTRLGREIRSCYSELESAAPGRTRSEGYR